jgi:UDP-glucuronate 4-epimerase
LTTFLVTGARGCIGAWTVRQLVREGVGVVALDVGGSDHRLRALLTDVERAQVTEEAVDVADLTALLEAFERHAPTHVLHLAALQVPMCAADPVAGARVNVVGTAAMFEAARRHELATPLVYASSIAAVDASTLYGVYKVANEGTARVYHADHGVSSIGLRPYVVYGVGRDQGLTSEPTKAMVAAAAGRPHRIPYRSRTLMQYAPDVAAAFVAAARSGHAGADVVNVPGDAVSVPEIVALIEAVVPAAAGTIEVGDAELPFPAEVDTEPFRAIVGDLPRTPIADGICETIALYSGLTPSALANP